MLWSPADQPGHPYKDNRTENLGALHSAVATLSRGPVSPADKIGLANRSQIMRACMDDGTLLSPERPALALDSSLLYRAIRGIRVDVQSHTNKNLEVCNWKGGLQGKFLADFAKQPANTQKTLVAAQEWCCQHSTVCGGITYQRTGNDTGLYTARVGMWPRDCDSNCDRIESWINPQAVPPPAPPLARQAPNGEIWATYSRVNGKSYRHVLVPLLRQQYNLTIFELQDNDGEPVTTKVAVYDNAMNTKPSAVTLLDSEKTSITLETCDRTDFRLLHMSPVLQNGWILVGETAKWVPVSAARVRSVSISDDAGTPVSVTLSGVHGERISFGFASIDITDSASQSVPVHYVDCVFGPQGKLLMTPKGCMDDPN